MVWKLIICLFVSFVLVFGQKEEQVSLNCLTDNKGSCAKLGKQSSELFDIIDNCDISELRNITTNTPELIKSFGYGVQTHKVVTQDYYVLTMYRILPANASKKDYQSRKMPVLFMHGLCVGSSHWFINSRKNNLPLELVDRGFDVYMGNNRGTTHSQTHLKYTVDDAEFWDFTWHEVAIYDIPAKIDYILSTTKRKFLTYVSSCQNGGSILVTLAERPEYNEKVKLAVVLTPLVYMRHSSAMEYVKNEKFLIYRQPILKLNVTDNSKYSARVDCKPEVDKPEKMREKIKICGKFLFGLSGINPCETECKRLPTYFMSTEQMSIYTLQHFIQNYQTRRFCPFDRKSLKSRHSRSVEEPIENITETKSGHYKPLNGQPEYDLSKISTKIALYTAGMDTMAGPKDMLALKMLLKANGNLANYLHISEYMHYDVVLGMTVKERVWDNLIPQLDKMSDSSMDNKLFLNPNPDRLKIKSLRNIIPDLDIPLFDRILPIKCPIQNENSCANLGLTLNEIIVLFGPVDNPDTKARTDEIIEQAGFQYEVHESETNDQYLLTLFRIPHGNGKHWKGTDSKIAPILFQHGFMGASWHHMGTSDLVANVEYILKKTKSEKLFYVAVSQGATQFFVALSERPEFNDKFEMAILLAPVAFMGNTQCLLAKYAAEFAPELGTVLNKDLAKILDVPKTALSAALSLPELNYFACGLGSINKFACAQIFFLIFGWNPCEMDCTQLPKFIAHIDRTSFRGFLHYAQLANSKKFREYDYRTYTRDTPGLEDLVPDRLINSVSPPRDYNLMNVKVPIHIFSGEKDSLSSLKDISILEKHLKKSGALRSHTVLDLQHSDFLWGLNTKLYVWDSIIPLIEEYNFNKLVEDMYPTTNDESVKKKPSTSPEPPIVQSEKKLFQEETPFQDFDEI